MRTRRIVLTLLAVGLVSSVCWVSVWSYATAWRDVPYAKITVGASYSAGVMNNYTLRAVGPKLVCVDIDSNVYHSCDPAGSPAGSCPYVGPPVFATPGAAEQAMFGCDPQVTIRTSNGTIIAGADDVQLWPWGAPNAAWANGDTSYDHDPFVCWFVPGTPGGVQIYQIQVQDSVARAVQQGCLYYLMTVTSNPVQAQGVLVPSPQANF